LKQEYREESGLQVSWLSSLSDMRELKDNKAFKDLCDALEYKLEDLGHVNSTYTEGRTLESIVETQGKCEALRWVIDLLDKLIVERVGGS